MYRQVSMKIEQEDNKQAERDSAGFTVLDLMVAMFIVSLFFLQMKKRTESIWGAVICHSGFNLGMIYSIFYWL